MHAVRPFIRMFARFGTKKAALPNPAVDVYQGGSAALAPGCDLGRPIRCGAPDTGRAQPARSSRHLPAKSHGNAARPFDGEKPRADFETR
jgi:hypothetical protein